MTQQINAREHYIEGPRRAAHQKAEETRRHAEDAIRFLLQQQRSITFKAVAETVQVSTAWLYANADIKTRIWHLRTRQVPKAQVKISAREQASSASKDAMIAALQKRSRAQDEKIKELEKQLKVAYNSLYQR
jgi:Family of unknown function (DUF6262)